MIEISSIDFGREPDRYQGLALAEPVVVTRDGRDSVAVISADEFRRLKRGGRAVLGIEDFARVLWPAWDRGDRGRRAVAHDDFPTIGILPSAPAPPQSRVVPAASIQDEP